MAFSRERRTEAKRGEIACASAANYSPPGGPTPPSRPAIYSSSGWKGADLVGDAHRHGHFCFSLCWNHKEGSTALGNTISHGPAPPQPLSQSWVLDLPGARAVFSYGIGRWSKKPSSIVIHIFILTLLTTTNFFTKRFEPVSRTCMQAASSHH